MDYDFSGLCADQFERLSKRLESLRKTNCKEYNIALNVINDKEANDKRSEMMGEICNVLNDVHKQMGSLYVNALNKVQLVLKEHL